MIKYGMEGTREEMKINNDTKEILCKGYVYVSKNQKEMINSLSTLSSKFHRDIECNIADIVIYEGNEDILIYTDGRVIKRYNTIIKDFKCCIIIYPDSSIRVYLSDLYDSFIEFIDSFLPIIKLDTDERGIF